MRMTNILHHKHHRTSCGNRHSRLSPAEQKNFHTTWKMCRLGTSVVITCYLWYRPRYLMLQTGLLQQGSCSQELQGYFRWILRRYFVHTFTAWDESPASNSHRPKLEKMHHPKFALRGGEGVGMEIHQDVIPHAIDCHRIDGGFRFQLGTKNQ